MLDGIVGYSFEFTNNQGYTINATQEKRWKATKTLIGIKRKLDIAIKCNGKNTKY